MLQAGIPRIIYIHHLQFTVLIPPAQHKNLEIYHRANAIIHLGISPVRAATNSIAP